MSILEMVVTVLCAAFASTGFWTYVQTKKNNKSAQTRMIIGLAHDRIMCLSEFYIKRGYITKEEYEDLYTYLYSPYRDLKGNGSAEHIMENYVKKLPMMTHEEWKYVKAKAKKSKVQSKNEE